MFLAVWSRNPLGNKCAENIYFVLVGHQLGCLRWKKLKEKTILRFYILHGNVFHICRELYKDVFCFINQTIKRVLELSSS